MEEKPRIRRQMGVRRFGNIIRYVPTEMLTPRQHLLFYLGQCDEGLKSTIIVGQYEDGSIRYNFTENTLSGSLLMVKLVEQAILESAKDDQN